MCGLAGFYSGDPSENSERVIEVMTSSLFRRGPDESGVWLDAPEALVALGHRRLAILDLTKAGHQPMHSSSGRYV